tara:strand:- start:597 stop:3869 length:3273 start_codon:yes stop_codon:yes gene_type:complete
MATTYGQYAEIEKTLVNNLPTGGQDKVYLYTSGSAANSRLYVKAGADTQRPLLTNEFNLQDATNGGLADFTYDSTANVTLSVDPTNATAITAVADGDLVLVADASDSNALKKITRAHFIESAALDSINIDGGAIDGTPIGASSAAAGTFTAVVAASLSASANLNVVGRADVEGALGVSGSATLGSSAARDTITVTGRFASDLVPSSDGARDLGTSALEWKDLYLDGVAYIDDLRADALGAAMNCASQAMTNINVDSGAIDGVTLGGNAQVTITDADMNGGSIDGVPIGAASAAAGTFTAIKGTTISGSGDLNIGGAAYFEGAVNVTGTVKVVGDLEVQGNLNSVTVTQNTLEVTDKLIVAGASGSSANIDGGGLMFGGSDLANDEVAAILWDHSNTALDFNIGTTTEIRLQNGVFRPETDDDVDLGASGAQWKDLYIDGVAYIDTLNADALGANLDHANFNSTNVDIDSGAIDGTVIGASSAAAGTFTAVVAASLSASANLNVVGRADVEGAFGVSGSSAFAGDVDLGNATSDTITATGRFDSDLVPSSDGARDLGTSTLEWKDLYLDGVAYIDDLRADALGAAMNCASQAMTNINVDSGAIDGVTLGGNAQVTITDADMNGGSIDGVPIGAASAAAGTFTTVVATSLSSSANLNVVGRADVEGALGVSGSATLGNADSDVVTVTAQLTASEGLALGVRPNVDMTAGACGFLLKDNTAAAMEIKEGSSTYMAFRTTNSQEAIVLGSNTCSDAIPSVNNSMTLGNASYAFANLFVNAIDLQGNGSISMGGSGRIDLDADDDTSIRASADDVITFEAGGTDRFQMDASMFGPSSADGAALGGASNEWSDLYLADSSVIYFGADQDIQLLHDADAGLTLSQNTDATGEPVLTLKTLGDLASGAELKFVLDNGAGEGDDDQLGSITFYGDDSGDAATKYAQIKVLAEDVTDTEEDGSITLSALVAGTMRDIMVIGNGAGVVLPSDSTYGTVKAHSFVTYSDENLKTNIQPMENALAKVQSLKGVTYDWKNDGSKDIGFIAQDVEKVLPQIVRSTDQEGSYSMNYSRVTALLVEGIKEQQAQIENLKKALASIKK